MTYEDLVNEPDRELVRILGSAFLLRPDIMATALDAYKEHAGIVAEPTSIGNASIGVFDYL